MKVFIRAGAAKAVSQNDNGDTFMLVDGTWVLMGKSGCGGYVDFEEACMAIASQNTPDYFEYSGCMDDAPMLIFHDVSSEFSENPPKTTDRKRNT